MKRRTFFLLTLAPLMPFLAKRCFLGLDRGWFEDAEMTYGYVDLSVADNRREFL